MKYSNCSHCKDELKYGHIEDKGNPFCSIKCILLYGEKVEKKDMSWEVVEEQISKNKQERINWKRKLGMSLTRYVARCKANKYTSNQTYADIISKFTLNNEETRRLKIGVCARYGEMATAQSEIKRTPTP